MHCLLYLFLIHSTKLHSAKQNLVISGIRPSPETIHSCISDWVFCRFLWWQKISSYTHWCKKTLVIFNDFRDFREQYKNDMQEKETITNLVIGTDGNFRLFCDCFGSASAEPRYCVNSPPRYRKIPSVPVTGESFLYSAFIMNMRKFRTNIVQQI